MGFAEVLGTPNRIFPQKNETVVGIALQYSVSKGSSLFHFFNWLRVEGAGSQGVLTSS